VSAVALNQRIDGSAGGTPLLLGGSLGTNLSMWEPQRSALAAGRRVIAFDQRGHGASPAPPGPYSLEDLGGDVIELLDSLEIERADYAGLSIGGMIGLWLAINAPGRVGRLVIICSSAHVDGLAFRERAAMVLAAGSPEVVAGAVLARWFTEPFARDHPDLIARMRAIIAATPAAGYAGCCEAIAAMDLRAGLPTITALTLVIGAGQDPSLPAAQHSAVIAAAIPGARYEIVEPAAHLASIERADAVNSLILDHLDHLDHLDSE
jgi:3-oxoadipate enol-lactonase